MAPEFSIIGEFRFIKRATRLQVKNLERLGLKSEKKGHQGPGLREKKGGTRREIVSGVSPRAIRPHKRSEVRPREIEHR